VIVVPKATPALVVQVIEGEETPHESQVIPSVLILVLVKLLKAKVEAEGEAVLSALPGKVITTFPLAGILTSVVN